MKYFFFFILGSFLMACSGNKQMVSTNSTEDSTIMLDEISVVAEEETRLYRSSKERIHDLLHTKLEVSFDWNKRHVLGKAELKLAPYFYETNELELDAKSMIIHSVSLVKGSDKQALEFTYDGLVLNIRLDKTYTRNESYSVLIDYTAKPEEVEQEGSSAIGLANGLYFINPDSLESKKPTQIWTQGETESSSCWFPTIDSPNERMTQEVAITVKESFKTLSNGTLIFQNYNGDGTRTDYWQQSIPHAPYLVMLAVGEFKVVEDSWSNGGEDLLVDYYMEPEYAPYAKDIFGNTPEMLSFYSEILGYPYPWEKYSQVIVRDFVSGAMENTTAVIHGDFLNATAKELKDSDNEDVIAHELFHHWFGDLVTCESWSNLPLNESFATYGEYLWIEHKYGREAADLHGHESMLGYLNESKIKQENLIRFYYDDKEDMFDGHSYNKGGRILHLLRYFLGDDAFFNGLQLYLKQNELKSVEIHQLRLAMEEVSGKDLNWFFSQWFLGKGHADLVIDYTVTDGQVEINVSQLQGEILRLPLQVDVVTSEGTARTRIDVRKKENSFILAFTGELLNVNVDADKVLLGTKKDNKPESWWAEQYASGVLFLDRLEALEHCLEQTDSASLNIIYSALKDDFWSIQETALRGAENLKDLYPNLETTLVSMVRKENKTQVQAYALETLCSLFNPANHRELLEESLTGDSYLVTSAALKSYVFLSSKTAMEKCKEFEAEDNYYISEAVNSVYSEHGTENELSYFLNKLENSSGFELYSLLELYAIYLTNQKPSTVKEGISVLEEKADTSETWWIRLAGLRGISTVIDSLESEEDTVFKDLAKELRVKAKAIKRKETDEQVLLYAPTF